MDVKPLSIPAMTASELEMVRLFWMYWRRISVRVPLEVLSLVMNCVTTVKGLVVSTVKLEPGP